MQKIGERVDSLMRAGKTAEAESLIRTRLEQVPWSESRTDVHAQLEVQLAEVLRKEGKLEEAEDYLRQALAIYERAYGPEAPETAEPLDALRRVYYQRKDYRSCEQVARRVLDIQRKLPNPNDPRIEYAIDNVLSVACLAGHCIDETELYEQLVAIRVKRFGVSSSAVLVARQLLAESYIHSKQFDKAIDVLRASLRASGGRRTNNVVSAWNLLALAYEHKGDFGQAFACLEEAAKIEDSNPNLYLREAVATKREGAELLAKQGKHGEAAAMFASILESAKRVYGNDGVRYADILAKYSDALKSAGKANESARVQAQAEAIYNQPAGR